MGRVKDVHSISNIMSILYDEEGVPLRAWTSETFSRIGKKWGEMLNIEDTYVPFFGRKRGHIREPDKQISEDPFRIYNILHKNQPHGDITPPSSSLSHPPGFTPVDLAAKTGNVHSNEVVNDIPASVNSPLIDVEVVNSPQEVHMEVPKGSIGQSVDAKGRSVLGVLEEVIRVVQAMGFAMEGCEKDIEAIIGNQGAVDFGPTPFRFYHSRFCYEGFDEMVEQSWRAFSHSDRNAMIRFKKKIQDLKIIIRQWIKVKRDQLSRSKQNICVELSNIDKELESETVSDTCLARRCALMGQLHDIKKKEAADSFQKSKVRWAIEGDENSSFFHGVINKKRSQLAIRGVFVDGVWKTDTMVVKEAFHNHFASRFKMPTFSGIKINFRFPNRLSPEHATDIERDVSRDEIREAV
nr:RNA-directed DNA polymerase, eukaryota, reverse transcriptase zinc-binding domain protein [Tanacetum cinerariifolium]GFB04234.1 RNA-directed DNA polymerase, eukaryota, reverse transcriptase zinc-binding domain protein [Tanacetum cinerariifolium]